MNYESALGIQPHLFSSWKLHQSSSSQTTDPQYQLYNFLYDSYHRGNHHNMRWDAYMFILLGFNESVALHLHHAFALLRHHYNPIQFLDKYISQFFLHRRLSFDPPIPSDRWIYDMGHDPHIRRYVSSVPFQSIDVNDTNCFHVNDLYESLGLSPYSHTLLYHATTIDSANLIAENGIDDTIGTENLDFNKNPAFYLTDNLRYVRLICWNHMILYNNQCAIVVFAFPSFYLSNNGTFKTLVFHNESPSWKQFVKNHRQNNHPPILPPPSLDIVIGPVCLNSCPVSMKKEEPIATNFSQICLLSKKAKDRMTASLCGIIYIDIANPSKKKTLVMEDYNNDIT